MRIAGVGSAGRWALPAGRWLDRRQWRRRLSARVSATGPPPCTPPCPRTRSVADHYPLAVLKAGENADEPGGIQSSRVLVERVCGESPGAIKQDRDVRLAGSFLTRAEVSARASAHRARIVFVAPPPPAWRIVSSIESRRPRGRCKTRRGRPVLPRSRCTRRPAERARESERHAHREMNHWTAARIGLRGADADRATCMAEPARDHGPEGAVSYVSRQAQISLPSGSTAAGGGMGAVSYGSKLSSAPYAAPQLTTRS